MLLDTLIRPVLTSLKWVIDAMKTKYSDLGLRRDVMDVRDLRLPASSVDVAIDKSTLDAMLHGSLWDPPADVQQNVGKYVDEVKGSLRCEYSIS